MLFLGEFTVTFSGPGRLVIPKKIREVVGRDTEFTLTKGYDLCLSGYKESDWKRGTEELTQTPSLTGQGMELKRHIFSSATQVEIDKQGRIIIPPSLLDYAGLQSKKDAVVIGVGDHFEIWETARWQTYLKTVEKKIDAARS